MTGLSFFQQVATRAGLTEVARHLGLSLPAVSKRLSQLEAYPEDRPLLNTPLAGATSRSANSWVFHSPDQSFAINLGRRL
ncbi:LysR family transcriptional regulator [Pseudomonas sp. N-137]|uniref:helix-turn-helix domain-containing protein n=1 Tax=Pseudomonas sp. N-137 TaxID=3108452 RepID=UPI002ADEADF7|nr:LysR family transcriptional regulator [Pseudomonas sp. N-137]MEA1029347.1 LysR family transcriptional regulator [Pseudomonas sp. N-137]